MATIQRAGLQRGDIALWDGVTKTATRVDATGGTVTGLTVGDSVDVLQVYGSGTDRTATTISTALARISTSVNVSLLFATGTWTIGTNLTIPSNFVSRIPAGCVFSVDSGVTLTFSGTVLAEDPANWTTGSGTVVVSNSGVHGGVYHRTAAERAASVTPTNYQYKPGFIDRYGTNTTPGTTDMSAAVQAAFSSGHSVRGEKGVTYYCGTTTISVPANTRAELYGVKFKTAVNNAVFLNVTGDDVEIHGLEIEGRGNSALSNVNERMVNFVGSSAAAYKSGLVLRDCYIHGSEFYGVYCEFAEDVRIERCHLHSIRHAAVGCQSVTRGRVNYNTIHDIGPGSSGNSYGVFFSRTEGLGDDTSYPRPTDCECIGNLVYDLTEWEALDTHAGVRMVFSNNIIRNCLLGIAVVNDSDDYAPRDCIVANNVIESDTLSADPYRAIGSGGSTNEAARNIVVTGNLIRGYGLDSIDDGAIMFQFIDGLVIADNIVEDSRGVAINILQEVTDFVVRGNVIRGVTDDVAGACGIYIRGASQGPGHIADNFIDSSDEFGIIITDSNTDVSFGRNRIITTTTQVEGAVFGGAGLEVEASDTVDAAEIADGDQAVFDVVVAGAQLGDYAQVACSLAITGLSMTAAVHVQDEVRVTLQNNSGGSVNIGEADFHVLVRKR